MHKYCQLKYARQLREKQTSNPSTKMDSFGNMSTYLLFFFKVNFLYSIKILIFALVLTNAIKRILTKTFLSLTVNPQEKHFLTHKKEMILLVQKPTIGVLW